jgi:membrane-bound ClpP family serine protease
MMRICSRILGLTGAAVFLIGGAFLYEIDHLNFLVSEAWCMVGGVVLIILGAVVAPKSAKAATSNDSTR